MPFLDDLVTVFENASVGTEGQNIFGTSKVAVPHLPSGFATMTIVPTPGTAPEFIHNTTSPAALHPGALILCRADDWDEAYAMAVAAYLACVAVRNQFINSGWYRWIRPTQEPFDAGRDERGQIKCAFNVLGDYSR